ncbi:LuxR C-terminal-related transcriptional regulator [Pengzhenrongella sp.]|jgi:DNA-binding CsgD family transcriptional regulator|uniref:LuxR C-terminal-related transcriptional regulator n=1 Tax=Pengzhenrongella sp. TaxID=2888820 RepID=UPI002F921E79
MSTLELVRQAGPTSTLVELIEPLTRRELVVLQNLSGDVTLEEIASKLFVTRNTIKSQVRSLYRKLGVSTRADAVAWAQVAGLR